MRRAPGL